MAEETPAAPAPTGESVANNPTNTNTNDAPAEGVSKTETTTPDGGQVDLHGFTPEQLGEMKKFFDNNGGFDSVKSKISNPEKQPEPAQPQQPAQVPTNNPQPNAEPGVVPINDLLLKDFFTRLSEKPEYAGIQKEIASGDVLKEAQSMGMNPLVDNGIKLESFMKFLDLKAKGAPAPQTSSEPEASPAPTVGYIPVGENIESKEQALQVLQQNMQLKAMGQAEHPATEKAKKFLQENWKK